VTRVYCLELFLLTWLLTIHIKIILGRDGKALVGGVATANRRGRHVRCTTEVQGLIHVWLVHTIAKRLLARGVQSTDHLALIEPGTIVREHDRAAQYLAQFV